MPNGILSGMQTTWTSIDTRLNPLGYYDPELNQKIAIHGQEWTGDFNDFMEYLWKVSELRHDAGARNNMMDLETIMRIRHIDQSCSWPGDFWGFTRWDFEDSDVRRNPKSEIELEVGGSETPSAIF